MQSDISRTDPIRPLEVERNDAFKRMNDFQDELEKLQNILKDKQLNRNKLHLVFALFQVIGLILISLR